MYRTSDFDFALPPHLIAQDPVEPRDASRLLVVDRATGALTDRVFADVVALFAPGDALVLNTTRVLRARLLGTRESGAAAEVFLLRPLGEGWWEAMVKPGNKLKPGRVVQVAPGFSVMVGESLEGQGTRRVQLRSLDGASDHAVIERYGHVPLPPYISRGDQPADTARYQTVYSREQGSVAAPTAGLHFTERLLAALQAKGVRRVDVLLHVGAGTFKPVSVDDPAAHVMHREWYQVSQAAADALQETRARGGRVWGVGTTTVRTLESCYRDGMYVAEEGETEIFIRPPHALRAVDRMITNFHLPKSTLVMLVAAMAGYELTMAAYRAAVAREYRFYSYGDAMAIL